MPEEKPIPKIMEKIGWLKDSYGISYSTARRLINSGKIPAYKVGGQIMVKPSQVEKAFKRIKAGE